MRPMFRQPQRGETCLGIIGGAIVRMVLFFAVVALILILFSAAT